MMCSSLVNWIKELIDLDSYRSNILWSGFWGLVCILFWKSWSSKSTRDSWRKCKKLLYKGTQAIYTSNSLRFTVLLRNSLYQWFSYIIQKLSDPARAHQLKLEVIAKALRWLEMDMDLDEVASNFPSHSSLLIYIMNSVKLTVLLILFFLQVECIMTILIYKNLVKGYLAHKNKVVVLSKQDPFPKLNGKPVGS